MSEEIISQIKDEAIYSNIIQKNDIYINIILKALNIVEKFIIDRNLVLVGGMAIDMALRKKGKHIYEDDAVPDYDFLSPEFHKDAYDLSKILVSQGFPEISVINARHPSTMRVRVNFISVADITYYPKNIYDMVPTLQYGKMRIIHPSFQYIDQHRSLSFPFEDPPLETIMQRWKKDTKRYDLLYNEYPLNINTTGHIQNEFELRSEPFKFKTRILLDQCIGGFPAIIFWIQKALNSPNGDEFKSKPGYKQFLNVYNVKLQVLTEDEINIQMPINTFFTVLSDNLWALLPKLPVVKKENKSMKKEQKEASKKEVRKKGDEKKGDEKKEDGKKEDGKKEDGKKEDGKKEDGKKEDGKKEDGKKGDEKKEDGKKEVRKGGKRRNTKHGAQQSIRQDGWYNAILDKFPRHVILSGFEIFDNKGNLLSAHKPWENVQIYFANLQSIMGYLLVLYFWAPNPIWTILYHVCRDLVEWAAESYSDDANIDYLPFLPTPEVYGNYNWSDVYILGRTDFKIKIGELAQRPVLDRPKKIYPKPGEDIDPKVYEFKPELSPLYQFDGLRLTNSFQPCSLP
jgi:hypothetical protein